MRQAWPDLLGLPFNEPVGWLAVAEAARTAAGRARFVLGGVKGRVLR